MTANLRRLWSIEGLLSNDGRKSRDDHRHHAIDAVVIALTGPRWVKALSEAAAQARETGRRRFSSIAAPWPGFAQEVREALGGIVISHRPDHKVGGAMHDESFYGRVLRPGRERVTVIRKPVHRLKPAEVDRIVDSHVRERVVLALAGGAPDKLEGHPPTLPSRDGREIPIRKVRITLSETPRRIGEGIRARNVMGDEYHHWEILRVADPKKKGKTRWSYAPVTVQEAMERVRDGRPVVRRDHGPETEFLCSVGKGEVLSVPGEIERRLLVVCALEATRNRIGFKNLNDARPYNAGNQNRERITIDHLLGAMAARKVCVTVLGRCFPGND